MAKSSALYVVDLKRFRQLAAGVSATHGRLDETLITSYIRIACERIIKLYRKTQIHFPISIKTCLIRCKINCQFSPSTEAGCGVKPGAVKRV
jgi:hypothetical protein